MVAKKKIKLSATRINSYLQCKQRYWFNYVDKIEKLPNPVFALGLACHETLETAGKLWMDLDLTTFSKEQIKELLEYLWKNKIWWLAPPVIIFIAFGVLVVFSETSPVGAFVYMLF